MKNIFMGKKKAVKKTKELSVAIAESSSLDAEGQQQPLTPRKRGRPRKIIAEKTEVEEVEEEIAAQEEEAHDVEGGDSKKVTTSDEKEQGQPSKMKEDATTMTTAAASSSKKQLSAPRSRARRKSKPRKSS